MHNDSVLFLNFKVVTRDDAFKYNGCVPDVNDCAR